MEPSSTNASLSPSVFNRFNDAFVKYAFFSAEGNKELLLDLVNAVFEALKPPSIRGRIVDLSFDKSELPAEIDEECAGLEFTAHSEHDETIMVSLQTTRSRVIKAANLYFGSRMLANQGSMYDLTPVVLINLNGEQYLPDSPRCLRESAIRARDNKELLTSLWFSIYVQAYNCSKFGDSTQRLTRWMQYFTCTDPEKVAQLAQQDAIMATMLQAEAAFSRDPKAMERYEAWEQYDRYLCSRDVRANDIARDMLEDGVSVERIKELTGTDEQIAKL